MTQSKRDALAEEHYQRTYGPDNTSEDKEFTLHDYQAGFNAAIEEVLEILSEQRFDIPYNGGKRECIGWSAVDKIKSLKEKV